MTVTGRGDPNATDTATPTRGRRQGSVSSRELLGLEPAPRAGPWQAIIFMLVLLVALGIGGLIFLGPALRDFAYSLANDNPQAMRLPFVADIVRDRVGADLDVAVGTDTRRIDFLIEPGDSVGKVGTGLAAKGLVRDALAFEYLVVTQGLDNKLQVGTFALNAAMTPQAIVDRLQQPPDPPHPTVGVFLRPGLRIEQIAAYLERPEFSSMEMKVKDLYDLATHPSARLLAAYPWLKHLPKGRSLEGFLAGGTFKGVPTDITAEDLLRLLLDRWGDTIGPSVVEQAKKKGLDFYQVLTVASIVERETAVDAERARIAGVYDNRLDPQLNATRILNADPTVVYAVDTRDLRKKPFDQWVKFTFWTTAGQSLSRVSLPEDLQSYQTYLNPGLPEGPIDTPTLASIQAAIAPDKDGGYLYFYACPDAQRHSFARTLAEQKANIAKCK